MDSKRLGRERDLTHSLRPSRGWRERRGHLQQLIPFARGDGELEARQKNADDQSEHMFAQGSDVVARDSVLISITWETTPSIVPSHSSCADSS
jgi:hypothetical protein